jgi:hypothetical protein
VFTRGIAATRESFSSFSDADKLIYFGAIFANFKHFENIHSQRQRGFIDDESWEAWSEHILMYFNPGGTNVVEPAQGELCPEFQNLSRIFACTEGTNDGRCFA